MCIFLAITGVPGVGSASLPGASRLNIASLEGEAHQFLEAGLPDSTRQVYRAGWNRFLSYARAFSFPTTPIMSESAILFVDYLGFEGLSFSISLTSQTLSCCHRSVLLLPFTPLAIHEGPFVGDTACSGLAGASPH